MTVSRLMRGLSDFWTVYFQDQEVLEALYTGAENLVGQAYLDLMSTVLTGSLRDTPVFNKEYIKSIMIRESELVWQGGPATADGVYRYVLPDNLVHIPTLNNRIYDATQALQRNVDYLNDERVLDFFVDPTNAYWERTFGTGNAAFVVRARVPGDVVTIQFTGLAAQPLQATRLNNRVTVTYDPAVHTVTDLVTIINGTSAVSPLVVAFLEDEASGAATPNMANGLYRLYPAAVNPWEGFSTRQVETQFGGKLLDNAIVNWPQAGVRKGDVLRQLGGIETQIRLVRDNALYVTDSALGDTTHIDYVILRERDGAVSEGESFPDTGVVRDSGADGVIDIIDGTFSSVSTAFSPVHVGERIVLSGLGIDVVIRGWVNSTTVRVGYPEGVADQTGVSWEHHTAITYVAGDGTVTDGETFSSPTASFTVNSLGKVIRVGDNERAEITEFIDVNTVKVSPSLTDGTGLTWGFASVIPGAYKVVFSTPIAWPDPETVAIRARRVLDNQIVRAGEDFLFNTDSGVITPITPWMPAFNNTVSYEYRDAVTTNNLERNLYDQGSVDAPGGTTFNAVEYTFTGADVGRKFTITNSRVNSGVYEITGLISGTQVSVTPAFSPIVDAYNGEIAWRFNDGTLTDGATLTFASETFRFELTDIGSAIRVTNGGDNSGVYNITELVDANTVTVEPETVFSDTTLNNGELSWRLLNRIEHVARSGDTVTTETQISFWSEDILVDRELLYTTYGYLINRYAPSSEEYKNLLRGLFQLFMLGPTVERFESAVNTAAGLPVVREDGEVFVRYSTTAEQSGTDAVLDGPSGTISAASGVFTPSLRGFKIYIDDGLNAGTIFTISQIIDATTVQVTPSPITDTGATWELSELGEQEILTTRFNYTFPRDVPVKERFKDPNNVGVLTLQAFEVLSDAFQVVDYLENPAWFESVTIPEELWPGESARRRQSSPALFENVVGAADSPRVGDPGLYVGADSEGVVPETTVMRSGTGGTVIPDPRQPYSLDNAFFTVTTDSFTSEDRGLYLVVPQGRFQVVRVDDARTLKIKSYVPLTASGPVDWELEAQPLPKRHKAAYVILKEVMQHHLFSIQFDASLLGRLSPTLVSDLEQFIVGARPSYTYILVSPSSLFEDILYLSDDAIEVLSALQLGGSGGEPLLAYETPLTVGSTWSAVGNWYRYYNETAAGVTPGSFPLTAPNIPAGMTLDVVAVRFNPELPAYLEVLAPLGLSGTSADLTPNGDDTAEITFTNASAPFLAAHRGQYIDLDGVGTFKITTITSTSQATIYAPGEGVSTGLNWEIQTSGSMSGQVTTDLQGQVYFQDRLGIHPFNTTHVGDVIWRPLPLRSDQTSYRIHEVTASDRVRVAEEFVISDFFDVTYDGDTVTLVDPNDMVFSEEEGRRDREADDYATSLRVRYYLENAGGDRAEIMRYRAANEVTASGALLPEGTGTETVRMIQVVHPTVQETGITTWLHQKPAYTIEGGVITPDPDLALPGSVDVHIEGLLRATDPTIGAPSLPLGDTEFHVGMPDPRKLYEPRTTRLTEITMVEYPVQIAVLASVPTVEVGGESVTVGGSPVTI